MLIAAAARAAGLVASDAAPHRHKTPTIASRTARWRSNTAGYDRSLRRQLQRLLGSDWIQVAFAGGGVAGSLGRGGPSHRHDLPVIPRSCNTLSTAKAIAWIAFE